MTDVKVKQSFDSYLADAQVPVLVDFWAEWCGPCKMMNPIIKSIANDYGERLKVIKVNVDQKPVIANTYQIQSIPTLMMFWNGKPVMRLAGVMPIEQFKEQIDSHWPKDAKPA